MPLMVHTDMIKKMRAMQQQQHAKRRRLPCTACAGPVGRAPAEELWFGGLAAPTLHKLHQALTAAGVAPAHDAPYLKAPVAGAAAPVIERAAAALSPEERAQATVAWVIAGVAPTEAVDPRGADVPLERLQTELRHRWFTRLLDERLLYMNFQPIVSLHAPEVYAHEALVRAQHDGRELSGFEIITTAETLGLLVPLDARTRVAAIEQFAASGLESKLFINFQPSAIYNPRYCLRTTFAALERTALRPQDVVFEVVESEDVTDTGHLRRIIQAYRDQGLGVAMDDFGVGYSTPKRLLQLHPDYVKLDKTLTATVDTDGAARRTLAAVVHMAHEEGCRVIAEGIETVAQRDVLREIGIEFGQGYLYARPARLPAVTWPMERAA
jgi:EAL domain-containing protein (putative c-di-GMP-specific phosphodiesterase class I)